jgi:hypothetical protein
MRAGRKGACRTEHFDDKPVMKPGSNSGFVEAAQKNPMTEPARISSMALDCIREMNYNSLIRERMRKKMRWPDCLPPERTGRFARYTTNILNLLEFIRHHDLLMVPYQSYALTV